MSSQVKYGMIVGGLAVVGLVARYVVWPLVVIFWAARGSSGR